MNIEEYIESGILELYVMGLTEPAESETIKKLADEHEAIRNEIAEISDGLELMATMNKKEPHPAVKTLLMATLNYTERLTNGEELSFPPMLHEGSEINDYSQWLDRTDLTPPKIIDGMFARLIGHTPEVTTAIVWLKEIAPEEVHHDEFERFLIVEGACDITIEDNIYSLLPGDFIEIPLHADHDIKVTSTIPCKVILQRVAA